MNSAEEIDYTYSARPVRNPLRYAAALWRLVSRDPTETTDDAVVVEVGFARSKLGRRFARWQETVDTLSNDPRMARMFEARRPFGPIVVSDLEALPPGTLGRALANHYGSQGFNPNLIHVPPDDAVGWLLNHFYQTHDIWHVVTGWGTDLPGEVGLGGFYSAQLRSPTFFGFMMAIIMLNVIWRRGDLDEIFAAFTAGYRAGRIAEPLFGTDWDALFPLPLDELRSRFAIDHSGVIGEGIREAA